MNRYLLVKSGIDFNQGLRRFNNNRAMYESFLLAFLKDENFAELCTAIERHDVKAAFQYAHSLKGIAGNLSMQKLYAALNPLVEELRADSLVNADALLEPVKETYGLLRDTLGAMQAD